MAGPVKNRLPELSVSGRPAIHFPDTGLSASRHASVRASFPTVHGPRAFLLSEAQLDALQASLDNTLASSSASAGPTHAPPGNVAQELPLNGSPTAEANEDGGQVLLDLPTPQGTYRFRLAREHAANLAWFLRCFNPPDRPAKIES